MPFVVKEILFALGAIGLSLLFILNSGSLPGTAALMPRILASLIIALSLGMIWQGLAAQKRMVAAGQKEEIPYINVKLVSLFLCFIIAYVVFMDILGYFIATPLFIVGTYMYLRALSVKNALLVAAGFCALVYGVFVKVLYLPVPLGLLENFLG